MYFIAYLVISYIINYYLSRKEYRTLDFLLSPITVPIKLVLFTLVDILDIKP